MVIFFFSLCLLLLLLLLLRLLLLFLLLLLHLSCPAQHQGCLLQRLVLTGTDVNIHPIPHFQKSFPLKPTPSPFPPAQHFACQSPPSSLLRSLFPLHKTTPFHGQPLQIPPFIHENAPFHGQPHQFPPLIHEKPIFHGQPFRNPLSGAGCLGEAMSIAGPRMFQSPDGAPSSPVGPVARYSRKRSKETLWGSHLGCHQAIVRCAHFCPLSFLSL